MRNLSPKYRSHNAAMQLVTVTKSSHLNKYGLGKVLKSFMDSISTLEKVKFIGFHRYIKIPIISIPILS